MTADQFAALQRITRRAFLVRGDVLLIVHHASASGDSEAVVLAAAAASALDKLSAYAQAKIVEWEATGE